jgi:hypothetical protein
VAVAYESQAGVERLLEDGMGRVEDKLREQDLVATSVDLHTRILSVYEAPRLLA